ncbi:unnamed protein product [Gordionus sp. m RMFG-2023]
MYTLDHLATFSCGQNQGLHHPLDAVNKLRLLEKSSGIWTQRMKIKLDKKDLHICSFEDAISIERFPLSKVLEPTAVITEDPNEIYNNILMFTVLQESKKKLNPLSEIHLFQCISVSAQEIVDEINRLKSGSKIKKSPKSYYVPPQMMSGSKSMININELSSNNLNISSNFNNHHATNFSNHNGYPTLPPFYNGNHHLSNNFRHNASFSSLHSPLTSVDPLHRERNFGAPRSNGYGPGRVKSNLDLRERTGQTRFEKRFDEDKEYQMQPRESIYSYSSHDIDGAESVASQQTEHDVMMLNHCFDDIENFISKLQHSNAALRELEKRKVIKKNSKNLSGSGMLSLRARPPSESEFVDIFQKFKLAFNLLARLKSCIHDPNAPELVHFLFRPLEMIVQALRQINYGSSDLTHHIVTPLLTNRAIDLLRSCLNSKETEFWHSLGEAWNYPQDHFRGYSRSFSPIFQDGWQTRYQTSEGDKMSESESLKDRKYFEPAPRSPMPPPVPSSASFFSDNHESATNHRATNGKSIHRNGSEKIANHNGGNFSNHNGNVQGYNGNFSNGTSIVAVERGGMSGDEIEKRKRFMEFLKDTRSKSYEVMFDRESKHEKELSVHKGEVIQILEDNRNWWKARNHNNDIGYVPYTILRPYSYLD